MAINYERRDIEKIKQKAKKYHKKLSTSLDGMLSPDEVIALESEADFCETMIEMVHDKKIPKYVIDFYNKLYYSVKELQR